MDAMFVRVKKSGTATMNMHDVGCLAERRQKSIVGNLRSSHRTVAVVLL